MNKNYLITGVTSGIGEAIAQALLKAGNNVLGLGRDGSKIAFLQKEYIDQLSFLSIDLASKIDNFELVDDFVNKKGKFDGLVYCAGVEETVPISLYNTEKLDRIFNVNFNSAFQLLRFISRKKNSNELASLIFISSVMGELGQSGKSGYCSSKSAILGLVKASALELAARKIRVNAVSPGIVETPMTEQLFATVGEEGKKRILDMHPLGFGNIGDIVPILEFLLSDGSRWITGQNFKIDGGYSIQ